MCPSLFSGGRDGAVCTGALDGEPGEPVRTQAAALHKDEKATHRQQQQPTVATNGRTPSRGRVCLTVRAFLYSLPPSPSFLLKNTPSGRDNATHTPWPGEPNLPARARGHRFTTGRHDFCGYRPYSWRLAGLRCAAAPASSWGHNTETRARCTLGSGTPCLEPTSPSF